MDDPEEAAWRGRDSSNVLPSAIFLALLLGGLLLARPTMDLVWRLAHGSFAWSSASPPERISYCGRQYHGPARITAAQALDITSISPEIEVIDGRPIDYPEVQTVRYNAMDLCSTVIVVHDDQGWVEYALVGGP